MTDFIEGVKFTPVCRKAGQKHTKPQVWMEFDTIPDATRHKVLTPQKARKLLEQLGWAIEEAESTVRPKKHEPE